VLGLLAIPNVFEAFESYVAQHPTTAGLIVAGVGDLYHCDLASAMPASLRTCKAAGVARTEGWVDYSFMPTFGAFAPGQSVGIVRSSHKAFKETVYDSQLLRDPDTVIIVNVSKIPKHALDTAWPGVFPIVIQMSTDDPERQARRELWADTLPALLEAPEALPAFAVPSGVQAADFQNQTARFEVVALNVLRQLFGAEVDWDAAKLLEFRDDVTNFVGSSFQYRDGVVGAAARLFLGDPETGIRTFVPKREHIESQVFPCPAARRFMQEAERRGMAGSLRLREFLFALFFAGLRGTPDMVDSIMKVILREPKKFVPLFKADPEAFMLEAARLNPTVGGLLGPVGKASVFHAQNRYQEGIAGGPAHREEAGDWYAAMIGGANLDPAVFGGPNKDPVYAADFIPGREHADRLVTWVTELRDLRRCKDAAGCSEAPRPCPGTHLARRVAKQAVAFFVDGVDAARGPFGKSEL